MCARGPFAALAKPIAALSKPKAGDVKVLKEDFTGADPSAAITEFRVQVDCTGQAFIRSYAVLTRATIVADSVVAYYGVPTPV
jgi:hypothetical protein